jgi:hypothetical protein
MNATIRLSFRRAGEAWWTVIERDCDSTDIESLAAEAAKAVLHSKNEIEKTEK